VTALWQRHDLTRIVLEWYARLRPQLAMPIDLIAVVSEDQSAQVAEKLGWRVVEHPNHPLSDKFNAGVQACSASCDGVIVIGSDDIACRSVFEHHDRLLSNGVSFAGFLDQYMLDLPSWRCCYFRYPKKHRRFGEPVGVGRLLGRRLLEATSWSPWPAGLDKVLDYGMTKKAAKAGFECESFSLLDVGAKTVDLKGSGTNMWGYNRLAKVSRRADADEVLAHFQDAQLSEQVRSFRKR